MDVRKWLEDTVGPGPSGTLALPLGGDAREEPAQQDDGIPSHQTRRCNHLFSDSSLLHVDRIDNVRGFSAHHPDHIGRPRRPSVEEEEEEEGDVDVDVVVVVEDNRPTTAPFATSDSHRSELFDPYARRPRHKTRPEIYEPKPGADKERTKRRRKKEKKRQGKKTSESRPKAGKDKPPHRQTHVFQPKNVSRERLTMKPNESIGLFKKGRASNPIKGRGLPDLVFSEMRFLQKQDDTKGKSQEETRNKRKRKDPTHVPGHEISAYFGARRPPLVDMDQNMERKHSGAHRSKSASLGQRPLGRDPTHLEPTRPTMELPDKPYLGFGSRGDPVASDPTYYIPWSESARNASIQPSEAALPPPRSSLRPYVQDAQTEELNSEDCGRGPGAPGRGKPPQRAGRVAMHIESMDGPIKAIPRSVQRQEEHPVPNIPVERSVPSRSNRSTVTIPDGELRLGNEGRRSTGHIEGSITNADRGQEMNCAVQGAGKLHEPSHPVSDHSVPDRRESRICEKNAHSPIAGATETARERFQRSSSPLDRLLRACDNACKEHCGGDKPSLEEAAVDARLTTKDGRIEESDESHHPSMPRRWASGGVPGQPNLYERQWPEDEVDDCEADDYGDFAAGNDFDMDSCIDVSAETGTSKIGWTGNGTDAASVPTRGYWSGFGERSGAGNGVVNARDDVEEPRWFWRRHRLY